METKNYTIRTVKLDLQLSEEDFNAVFDTCKAVNSLYTSVVMSCNDKQCVNYYNMATPAMYASFRELNPSIPSMLVQQMIKEACTNTKQFNTKHVKHKWTFKGLRNKLSYPLNKRTLSCRGNLISFSTCFNRIKVLANLPDWFASRYNVQLKDFQSATVKVSKSKVYLCLSFRVPITTENNGNTLIGIDRGLYNVCTLSDGTRISSKQAVAVKRKYQYLRDKLQQKGTRSAKRHLKKIAGRERRFMSDFNHKITKQLASRSDVSAYILEDLSNIGKQRKGKKLNSWLSNWSYYQFEQQLKYKCDLQNISVFFVDPRYTSQKCSCCGVVDKNSRNKSKYLCTSCGYTEHADVNAAINIRDNYVRSKA